MTTMKIDFINPKELNPSEYNPRKITEEDKAHLKTSLQRFGFVEPIIVNSAENRKNIIIGGHQRFYTALELGLETVPVHFVQIEDIAKERELNLRLNRNLGQWDWDKLKTIGLTSLELLDIGFKDYEISPEVNPDDFFAQKTDESKEPITKMITCPHCGKEFDLNLQ